MGWSTVPEGKGKACQALSIWEESLTTKGTALRFLPLNEEVVTVTWQILCKDKFCLIPQGHLPQLWTVMSAACYNLPYIDCTSTINDTSQSAEMITSKPLYAPCLLNTGVSHQQQELPSYMPSLQAPKLSPPVLNSQLNIIHWARQLYRAAPPGPGDNSYQQLSSEFLMVLLTDHCVMVPFCILSLPWHGW